MFDPKKFLKSCFVGLSPFPFLFPILGAASFFIIHRFYPYSWITQKPYLETIALILTGSAVCVAAFRVRIEANPLMLIMLAWTASFFMREIHFVGTNDGIVVAAVAILIWVFIWRERLNAPFHLGQFKSWFFTVGLAYFIALFVQRRGLKHLPFADEDFRAFEQSIHVGLEEYTEIIAHACLLILCFCGYCASNIRDKKNISPD